jgi:hypothetical protein
MSYPREHFDLERLDLMSADIAREGEVLRRSTPALRERSAEIASAVVSPPARVYLVGCGDSLDAGIAASYQWERLLRIPVEAVPAMTFATSVIDLRTALVDEQKADPRMGPMLDLLPIPVGRPGRADEGHQCVSRAILLFP